VNAIPVRLDYAITLKIEKNRGIHRRLLNRASMCEVV